MIELIKNIEGVKKMTENEIYKLECVSCNALLVKPLIYDGKKVCPFCFNMLFRRIETEPETYNDSLIISESLSGIDKKLSHREVESILYKTLKPKKIKDKNILDIIIVSIIGILTLSLFFTNNETWLSILVISLFCFTLFMGLITIIERDFFNENN